MIFIILWYILSYCICFRFLVTFYNLHTKGIVWPINNIVFWIWMCSYLETWSFVFVCYIWTSFHLDLKNSFWHFLCDRPGSDESSQLLSIWEKKKLSCTIRFSRFGILGWKFFLLHCECVTVQYLDWPQFCSDICHKAYGKTLICDRFNFVIDRSFLQFKICVVNDLFEAQRGKNGEPDPTT